MVCETVVETQDRGRLLSRSLAEETLELVRADDLKSSREVVELTLESRLVLEWDAVIIEDSYDRLMAISQSREPCNRSPRDDPGNRSFPRATRGDQLTVKGAHDKTISVAGTVRGIVRRSTGGGDVSQP
jgi:hypothetical protein